MFQNILVPVDLAFRPKRRRALPVAVDLAQKYGGRIHGLTVLPDYGMPLVGSYFPSEYAEKAALEAERELRDLFAEYVPQDLVAAVEVRRGTIYQQILAAASDLACDSIVMAAHRPEMKDYLIGSNASRVVRHAEQMVVVVR